MAGKKKQPRVALAYPAFFGAVASKIPNLECLKVPKNMSTTDALELIKPYDMIVFSGGEDIDPSLYGERREFADSPNSTRDAIERLLAQVSLHLDKKIFAICRGHQLMNTVEGGSLWQDITLSTGAPGGHPGSHPLEWVAPHPIIDAIKNLKFVNSMHHQGIRNWGNNVKIIAKYKNLAEVTVMHQNKILTVQWHPEFMSNTEDLFTYLLEDWVFDDRKNPVKVSDEVTDKLRDAQPIQTYRMQDNFGNPGGGGRGSGSIRWEPGSGASLIGTSYTSGSTGTVSASIQEFSGATVGTPRPRVTFARIGDSRPLILYNESPEEQVVTLQNTLIGTEYTLPIDITEVPVRGFNDLHAIEYLNSVGDAFAQGNMGSSDVDEEEIHNALSQLWFFNRIIFTQLNDNLDEETEEDPNR